MSNVTRSGKGRMAATAAVVVILLCAGLYFTSRYIHGDSAAPVQIVPQEWLASLQIADSRLVVDLEFKVDVLKTGTGGKAMVPLFPEGTVFGEITVNGKAVVPVRRDGWVCVEMRRAGIHRVQCSMDVKVSQKDGISSCSFRKGHFVRSFLRVDSGAAWEVAVAGTPQILVGDSENGTHGEISAGLLEDVEVTWRVPRERAVQQGNVSVTPSVVWTVKEKVIAAEAILDMVITGGARDAVSIEVPHGIGRIQIPAGIAANWQIKDRSLILYFDKQVAGQVRVELSFEVPRLQAEIAVCPAILAENGHTAQGGCIVVVNDTPGVMLEASSDGLEEIADIEIPAHVRGKVVGKPQFVYRVARKDAAPVFDVVTKELFPMVDTIADRAEILTVVYEGGEEMTRAVYVIRNNSRQFLRMAMPQNSELISVNVDNRRRTASSRDGFLLVPLEDSIQALGGLVPFPVEVIYCRQGDKPGKGKSIKVDLPELPDVPVASVNVRVFFPDDLVLADYRSALSSSKDFSAQPDFSLWTGLPSRRDANGNYAADLWAYNAYWLGYRAYRENRIEDAEALLAHAEKAAVRNRTMAELSRELLKNIQAGRGEVKGKSKFEKAQIVAIQGSLAAMNDQIEVQQSQLIRVGLENLESGNEELGAELLKEADELGSQIGNRGGSTLRQSALRKGYAGKLTAVEDERRKKRELEETLVRLQDEARRMAANAPADARKLGRGLVSAANEENLAADQVGVLDLAWGKSEQRDEFSAGARAQAVKQQLAAQGSASEIAPQKKGKALEDRNRELKKKVSVLEKAISYAKSVVGYGESGWGAADSEYVRQSVGKNREKIADVKERLSRERGGNLAANDYYQTRKDIQEIRQQVEVSKSSFQGAAGFDDEISALEQEVVEAERQIAEQGEALRANTVVEVATTNLFANAGRNTLNAFEDFMNFNYNTAENERAYVVSGGALKVANAPGQVERINEVLNKFEDNDGNVVRFGARKLDVNVNDAPVLQNWFTNSTANGNAYAILNEAQYNTLVFAGGQKQSSSVSAVDQRDIIVGTPNSVLGNDVRLTAADGKGNGIRIDGTDLQLGHDQYIAFDNGGEVTVLKGGAARNWQDAAEELGLEVEVPFKMEIPERGQVVFFQKTLLSAGESADIDLVFGG